MSEYDINLNDLNLAMIELESNDLNLGDDLKKIDTDILEGLAKQLSYSDVFHQETWKHNVFGKVGWSKAL
jgi:hypothetical protein